MLFSVENQNDVIQSCHCAGGFYESEELAIMSQHFPVGGRFLDIGANVGNHSMYMLLFLHAREVVPVEPNPVACRMYLNNVVLNKLEDRVDFSWLGVGVSNAESDQFGLKWGKRNLGGAKLIEGSGDISVVSAGAIVEGREFDMIKIDVEGMELLVLDGLREALKINRPNIFVEVDQRNEEGFRAYLEEVGYRIKERFKRYSTNCNYLIVCQEKQRENLSDVGELEVTS